MTLGGLTILILMIGFVWSNILCIRDLYKDDTPHPLYGSITITGWLLLLVVGVTYGITHIDWTYKLF